MAGFGYSGSDSNGSQDPSDDGFAAAVRSQLHRIIASRHFSKSPQATRLLSFLIEQSLSPDTESARSSVKEYAIAVQVFGRPLAFDPAADNIVRVEVRRVRSKLEMYYTDEGATDPIVISIPKGAYVPHFHTRDVTESDLTGKTISHYELMRRVCANKWQSTYDANCHHLNRPITLILATKATLEDERRRKSLLESTQAGAIDHPFVSAIHDVEASDTQILIAAGSLPGRSLQECIAENGPMSHESVLDFANKLATAIAAGHEAGVAHGNLQPHSINLDDGPHRRTNATIHMMPFGIGPLVELDHPCFDDFRPPGSSDDRELDMRSDVWSFGALVWFAWYGVAPPSPTIQLVPPPKNGGMPSQLAQVVARCLHVDPALRYANATEILEDLRHSASSAVEEPAVIPSRFRPKLRRTVALTAILLAALIAIVMFITRLQPRAATAIPPRIVILPLSNVNGDAESEAYCREIEEMLAARLTRLPGSYVISSLFVDPSKREQLSTDFLQKNLRVDYAVSGSFVRTTKSHYQATVSVVSIANGTQIWTASLRGEWSDIAANLEQFADKSAQDIGLAIEKGRSALSPRRTVDDSAYDAWLKGKFAAIEYWNTSAASHFEDAERRLRSALEIQPRYVDAMVDLGLLYLSAAYPPKGNQAELFEKAQKLAEAAVAVDPGSSSAHALLGSVYTDTGRARLAMPHIQRAIDLSPNDPNPHNFLSIAYEAMGFWESSQDERQKATQRDPVLRGIRIGGTALLARLGRAQEALRITGTLDPDSPVRAGREAYIYLMNGQPRLAEAMLARIKSHPPPGPSAAFSGLLALAQAEQGDAEIARRAVEKLATAEHRREDFYVLLCAVAGDKERLVEQIASHSYIHNYRWLVREPRVRPYRSYPPFQKLVRDAYQDWRRNLAQFGPALPSRPAPLPSPEEYLGGR